MVLHLIAYMYATGHIYDINKRGRHHHTKQHAVAAAKYCADGSKPFKTRICPCSLRLNNAGVKMSESCEWHDTMPWDCKTAWSCTHRNEHILKLVVTTSYRRYCRRQLLNWFDYKKNITETISCTPLQKLDYISYKLCLHLRTSSIFAPIILPNVTFRSHCTY